MLRSRHAVELSQQLADGGPIVQHPARKREEVMCMIVSLVRFKSKLSDDAVQATFEERADRYRTVPGLVEKIYLRFRESGEFGAVYVWDSEKALMDFRETELARTIPDVYQVEEAPLAELADVCLVIQSETERVSA
jgi:putative monooxygenase ydhR